jgi:hypothetical protein
MRRERNCGQEATREDRTCDEEAQMGRYIKIYIAEIKREGKDWSKWLTI